MLIVSCSAERATLEARLRERSRRGDDPSEATLAVLEAQLQAAEPFSEDELGSTVQIDTGSQAASCVMSEGNSVIVRPFPALLGAATLLQGRPL